jgi:hypothetical protein
MHSRRVRFGFAVGFMTLGVLAAFAAGLIVLGVLGCAVIVGLLGWWMSVARRRPEAPQAFPFGDPKPATAPPDGHIRFTLVIEGLGSDKIAEVWAVLCRPGAATAELRLLFQNFTVVEGRRFRFRGGDPAATAALLTSVLGNAAGVPVRTVLEPAAERTPPWS